MDRFKLNNGIWISTYQYLKTGEVLGKCMSMEKEE